MPLRSTCGALLLVLGLGRLALTQPATSSLPQEVGSGRIGELIQQLLECTSALLMVRL